MKTFKEFLHFIKESIDSKLKDLEVDQGAIVNGFPTAVVYHGQHSLEGIEPQQGTLDKNGVPCAYVDTSRDHRRLKEDFEDSYFSHNENTHIHPTQNGVDRSLSNSQTRKDLDHFHLNKYTSGSRMLNKALWAANKAGTKAPTHVNGMTHTHDVKELDKAVNRNKLNDDLHVYSGVGFDPAELASKHPEGHVHLPAYTSTTIDKSIARNFGANQTLDKPHLQTATTKGHIMHIALKAGQKGAYISDSGTEYKKEHEFLLPRDTILKHNGTTTHQDEYGDDYLVHHMEVVPQDKKK
jgi:hypothetical protein